MPETESDIFNRCSVIDMKTYKVGLSTVIIGSTQLRIAWYQRQPKATSTIGVYISKGTVMIPFHIVLSKSFNARLFNFAGAGSVNFFTSLCFDTNYTLTTD